MYIHVDYIYNMCIKTHTHTMPPITWFHFYLNCFQNAEGYNFCTWGINKNKLP